MNAQRRRASAEVARALAEAAGLDDGAASLLRALGEALACDQAVLWEADPAAGAMRRLAAWQAPGSAAEAVADGPVRAAGEGLPGRVLSTGRPAWAEAPRALAVPVAIGHRVLGAVELHGAQVAPPDQDLLETLADIGGQVAQFMGRVQAEERLGQAERELAASFESAALGLHWVGPDGTILRANQAELDMLGYDRDEYVGHHIAEFHVDRPVIDDILRRLRAGETLRNYEARLRCKDGSVRYVQISSNVHREADRFIHTRCFTTDITERRQAEMAVRRWESIFDRAGWAVAIADPAAGTLVAVNPAFARMHGFTVEELVGRPLADTFAPESRADLPRHAQLAHEKGDHVYESVHMRKDGSRFPCLTHVTAFKDDEGRVSFRAATFQDLTEIRASEQRFTGFMQHLPGLAWIKDLQGRYAYANDAARKVFPPGFEGRTDEEVFPPETAAQFIRHDREALASGTGILVVETLEHADGVVHHSLVSKFPIPGPGGGPELVGGMAIDITDRVRADEQTHFQARLLDAVEQAAVATDAGGTIIYWNRYAETLYGWTREEAVGRSIVDTVVAPESVGPAEKIMERLRAGESWSGEFTVRRKDGTVFPAFVTDTPIHDRQGHLQAIIGISVDITERRQGEDTLRFLAEASATLASVVDYESTLQKVAALSVPRFADWCAVDMVEANGSLRRLAVAHQEPGKISLAHELQRRYPPDPDLPRGAYHVLRTGRSELGAEITDQMLGEAARDPEHLRILRELGLRSYMCVALRVRNRILGVLTFVTAESGRRYGPHDLAFAEELARRAAIAIENSQLYADLREADRLKDEFLAMLAHELRNPLTPIRNALHVMKTPSADRPTLEQLREMAERQVQHMARLLDDLLDVSRIRQGKIHLRQETVDVSALVNRTLAAARPMMEGRQHRLTVDLPSEPLRVKGDPTRLEQIVANLLNNAAKYTDPGGRISLSAQREGAQVALRVKDSGVGIDPEMLPRIFDLFVQAERRLDRSQGGVGIGLTLVRRLVELHGGSVQASSEGRGQGSEFVVRLPALPAASAGPQEDAGEDRPSTPLPPLRVLVVDDNHDAADSLAMMLRFSGQEVSTAYSGSEALEVAATQAPKVVFLDIGMPGMDGYEVAARLRATPALSGIVLVALTGWGQQEDRRRTKEAGFDHHLVKPVEPQVVQELLASISGQGGRRGA